MGEEIENYLAVLAVGYGASILLVQIAAKSEKFEAPIRIFLYFALAFFAFTPCLYTFKIAFGPGDGIGNGWALFVAGFMFLIGFFLMTTLNAKLNKK